MSQDKIQLYISVLHTNTIQSVRVLIRACETFNIDFKGMSKRSCWTFVLNVGSCDTLQHWGQCVVGDESEMAAEIDAVDENQLLFPHNA